MKSLLKCQKTMTKTTGNLSDFSYHQNHCKLFCVDLSRQTNTNIPQQINFKGKLEEDNGITMFLIAEKQQKQFKIAF